jgi:hypothetical protein
MNSTAIIAAIAAIQAMLSQFAPNAKTINAILALLIQIVPIAIKEVQAVVPAIKGIIAALSQNPAATADQLTALAALDASTDAAFESAVSAYLANHPANPTQPA